MNEPEPADDKPAPEIRGGNRPLDWISKIPGAVEANGEFAGTFEKDGCPGHPDDNKWAAIHEPDDEDDEGEQ